MKQLFALLLSSSSLFALSEQELMEAALTHSYGIRLNRIEVSRGSISLAQSRGETAPELNLSGSATLLPIDTISGLGAGSANALKGDAALEGVKRFAGGGTLSASAGAEGTQYIEGDSTTAGSKLALTLSQPLLRGAFSQSNYRYAVSYDSLSLIKSSLQGEATLIAALSEVRSLLIAQQSKTVIRKQAELRVERAEQLHTETAARFAAGTIGELDLLSSDFARAQADNAHFIATEEEAEVREELAYLTGLPASSAVACDTASYRFPDTAALLQRALQHPDLSLLAIVDSTLALSIREQEDRTRPALSLDLGLTRRGAGSHLTDERSSRLTASIGLRGSLSLPHRRIRQEIAKLEHSRRAQTLKKEERETYLRFEIRRLKRLWEREEKRLDMLKKEAALALKLSNATNSAYDLGAVPMRELRDRESESHQATLAQEVQHHLLASLSVAIEKLSGDVLKRYNIPSEEQRKAAERFRNAMITATYNNGTDSLVRPR